MMGPDGAVKDLSFLGLFMLADPVVKGVMISLVVASIACWAVIFEKTLRISFVKREARKFEAEPETAATAQSRPPMRQRIASAGFDAAKDVDATESRAERRERIEKAMRTRLFRELRVLQSGLPFLATTGSAAPFIGLFGTVWGIMNSFTAIAGSQDTSLAVVAPGLAEALLATAIGLAAAIPAVVAYNKLIVGIGRIQQMYLGGISELGDRLAKTGVAQAREPSDLGGTDPRESALAAVAVLRRVPGDS